MRYEAGVLLFTLLFAATAVSAASEPKDRRQGEQLVVRNITPGQKITEHEWGIVRLELGVEKKGAPESGRKAKLRHSPLKIKVDDREADCFVVDSATGYDGKKTYAYKTVALHLGAQQGPRTITVLYDGLAKSVPITYNPSGQLEFADLYDRQAIFGKKAVTIHWFGCCLQESVKASLNGMPLQADAEVSQGTPELLSGRISPGERLKPGTNRVRIEAIDISGRKCAKELVLQYYPDNRVPMGDEFAISLGLEEPKNGPFYDTVVKGKAVVRVRQSGQRPAPESLGGRMVVPPGKAVLAWFKAAWPGESTIATMMKQYATDEPTEVERKRVAVYQAAPPPDAPHGNLEKYLKHLPFWPSQRTGK